MQYVNKANRSDTGFTLVELMVALVLGLIVVGGSLALFSGQRVTSTVSGQMVEMQNEGRLALDALARDVRAARDYGCWPVQTNYVRVHSTTYFSPTQAGIRGFGKSSSVATEVSASALPGSAAVAALQPVSDVIAVTGISGSLSQLVDPVLAASVDAIYVSKPSQDFSVKDVVVVTDCLSWSMVELTDVTLSTATSGAKVGSVALSHALAASATSSDSGGNKYADLGAAYKAGATVGRMDTTWWFVRDVDGKKGLYRLSARDSQLGGQAQLVSTRVEDMRVRYDIATGTNGQIDLTSQSASSVAAANWVNVRRAIVEVLVRSDRPAASAAVGAYTFGGADYSPTDKHLYLPLELAVALRNQ